MGAMLPLAISAARLPHNVVPVKQSIYLKLDSNQPDYTGSTVLKLRVNQPTSQFQFHAENLEITKLTLSDKQQTYAVSFEPADSMTINVIAEKELPAGDYTMAVEFTDDFNTDAVALYRA
jgi:alanyl aminopeptidase